MIPFLNIAAITSIGLMIGTELAVSAFINPTVWQLEAQARAQAVQLFAKRLGAVMPFWYSANLLLLLAEATVERHRPEAPLVDSAVAIWIFVIASTLMFLVPINNRLARPDSPLSLDQKHREHKRWDALHRVRVVVLIAAMLLFLVAVR
jgi:uncharacterized membrane protein